MTEPMYNYADKWPVGTYVTLRDTFEHLSIFYPGILRVENDENWGICVKRPSGEFYCLATKITWKKALPDIYED